MKFSRSIHGLLLSCSILLALSGTGFASWCFMANERHTEIKGSLTVTDLSTEGSIHLRSDCDPFFAYTNTTFNLIKSHDAKVIKDNNHYMPFLYSPKDPVQYTMISDIEENGEKKQITVFSPNQYTFHEEVWIPKKTITINNISVSLADLIDLKPEAQNGNQKFTLVTEDSPLYQEDYKIYTLDLGPTTGNTGNVEEEGKSIRFSAQHNFSYNEKYAIRDYTGVIDPNNTLPSSLPLLLTEDYFTCLTRLMNEPDNQILFRVSASTKYNTWDPKE